jgi:hypothetical protein
MIPWQELKVRFDEIGLPIQFGTKEEAGAFPAENPDPQKGQFVCEFHKWLDGKSCMLSFVKSDGKFEVVFTERLAKKFWEKYGR